jgi:hypothetical protein
MAFFKDIGKELGKITGISKIVEKAEDANPIKKIEELLSDEFWKKHVRDPIIDGITKKFGEILTNEFEKFGDVLYRKLGIDEIRKTIDTIRDIAINIGHDIRHLGDVILAKLKDLGDKIRHIGDVILAEFIKIGNTIANFGICFGMNFVRIATDFWDTFLSVELCGWFVYTFFWPFCPVWWLLFIFYIFIKGILFTVDKIFGTEILDLVLNLLKSFDFSYKDFHLTKFNKEITCKCFTTGNFKYLIFIPLAPFIGPYICILMIVMILAEDMAECSTGGTDSKIPFLSENFIFQLKHWERDSKGNIDNDNYYDCTDYEGCKNVNPQW